MKFIGFKMRKSIVGTLPIIFTVQSFRAHNGFRTYFPDVVVGSLKKLFYVKLGIAEKLLDMILVF